MAYMQSWAHLCMRTGRQTDVCWGQVAHRFVQCARAHAHEPTWRQLSTGRLTSGAVESGSSGPLPWNRGYVGGAGVAQEPQSSHWPCSSASLTPCVMRLRPLPATQF